MAEITQPELETPVTTNEELTTNDVSIGGESSQLEGLQVFGENVVAVVEETSFSIADMIKELSHARG